MKDILLNKRNQKVFIIALFVAILVFASFSYAYFIGSIGGSASTDVDVTTSVNERLVFTEGTPIGIHATLDNFYEGAGSLTGDTTSTARLNASSGSTATEKYQVYFDIELNNFEYSKDVNTPELILTVTDPEGNIITTAKKEDGSVINSKSVTTLVQDESGNPVSKTVIGFDVTDYVGFIHVYEDYTIANNSPSVPTIQEWDAEITFINLDSEQTINEGKTFKADLILQQDKMNQLTLVTNMMVSGSDFYNITSDYRMDMSDPQNPVMPSKTLNKIVFNSTINEIAYNTATNKWDVSALNDGSVVAYLVTENSQEVMYVESNGKVIAHPDQTNLLFDIENMQIIGSTPFMFIPTLTEIDFNNSYDTSQVTDMSNLFFGLISVNSLDLSTLDTQNVTNMSGMFYYTTISTNLDLSVLNTSKVKNMSKMFLASQIDSVSLNTLDTSSVTDMSEMFSSTQFQTLNLSTLDTSSVTNMSKMFSSSRILESINFDNVDTSSVTDMSEMFKDTISLNTIDISMFDTSKVTNMSGMFFVGASLDDNLISINLGDLNTSNVTDMSYMFSYRDKLTVLDVSSLDTENVKDMSYMFSGLKLISELDLINFDTINVTDMSNMFINMIALTSLNISSFNTSNVNSMVGMFYGLRSITELNVLSFTTNNVTNMASMFSYNVLLTSLDISSFDTTKVTNMNQIFMGTDSLSETLYAKTQVDADKFNDRDTTFLKAGVSFTVKP